MPPTADDVAAVVLVTVPYVQQQVGAVGVGPVSGLGAAHRLILHLLIVPVEVQLSHTTNNTVSGKRLVAAIPVTDCVRNTGLYVNVLFKIIYFVYVFLIFFFLATCAMYSYFYIHHLLMYYCSAM